MKFERRYEIERVVYKDKGQPRPTLENVYLDVENKVLVATNGSCLAMVPATGLDESPCDFPHDETGFVSVPALKAARKLAGRRDSEAVLSANGKHVLRDGSTMPRPQPYEGCRFPPYQQVIPPYRRGDANTVTVGITPELLCELSKAIGLGGRAVALTFPLPEPGSDMLDPYVVEGEDGAIGVLMPARV